MRSVAKRWIAGALKKRGYHLLSDGRLRLWEHSTHLSRLLNAYRIDCVLDVGANIGQYRDFLRGFVGYSGRIISFEPVSEFYETLQRRSSADDNWSVHKLALGETSAQSSINITRRRTMSSFLPRDEAGLRRMGYPRYLQDLETVSTELVPVRRLDEVFAEIVPGSARVFLKSDAQGYDMSVLRGAAGCVDSVLGIQVELSVRQVYEGAPSYLDGLAELAAMGYELTALYPARLAPAQRDSLERVVNVDCLLIQVAEADRLRRHRGDDPHY